MKNYLNQKIWVAKCNENGTVTVGYIPAWLEKVGGLIIYGVSFFLASKAAKLTWDDFCIFMAKEGTWTSENEEN